MFDKPFEIPAAKSLDSLHYFTLFDDFAAGGTLSSLRYCANMFYIESIPLKMSGISTDPICIP
ncbi:hypothetical protein NECAME_05181 [Necator americanus]|uniref:Uncharacterized protein n=1 Tax=Necator americanus TaxID=51031 RepID=W2SIW3_NECAM|nr:hypothetical protein NECAME_05181 [Necator americanus]ETN69599.1 hypothetical protein NECAME_05181 [Necator americanus]